MLHRIATRFRFTQDPTTVLTYLRTVPLWKEWYPRDRRFEGVMEPLTPGDVATVYISDEEGSDNIVRAMQWTCVDLWEDKMYRIEGRVVSLEDGSVAEEVTAAINYTLFPAPGGGTDFTREVHRSVLPGDPVSADPAYQAEAMKAIQRELDRRQQAD